MAPNFRKLPFRDPRRRTSCCGPSARRHSGRGAPGNSPKPKLQPKAEGTPLTTRTRSTTSKAKANPTSVYVDSFSHSLSLYLFRSPFLSPSLSLHSLSHYLSLSLHLSLCLHRLVLFTRFLSLSLYLSCYLSLSRSPSRSTSRSPVRLLLFSSSTQLPWPRSLRNGEANRRSDTDDDLGKVSGLGFRASGLEFRD